MNELKIDNQYLNNIADDIEDLHKKINNDVKILRDESADTFLRFMSFNRSQAYLRCIETIMDIMHNQIIFGHALSEPMFKTEEYIEKGWDTVKLHRMPFFVREEDKDGEREIPDFLKKILAGAILGSLVGKEANDRNK